MPDGHLKTFAEMTLSEKNQISHRGKALQKARQLLAN
jgi:inosine/xanthosine triphosphate pyrophosphatase family protein